MKYEIDLSTQTGRQRFNMAYSAANDFEGIENMIENGMTLEEACEAQADSLQYNPYNNEAYDGYIDTELAKSEYMRIHKEEKETRIV